MAGRNTTFQNYDIPKGCSFIGKYKFDVRCRFYYEPSIHNISIAIFDPQLIYNSLQPQLGSIFCQRRLQFQSGNLSSEGDLYSLLCITLNLTQISNYFQNFGSNSIAQIVIDPRQLTVAYDSQQMISKEMITLDQLELRYLQDKNQSEAFLKGIHQMSQFILDSQDSINNFKFNLEQAQKVFQYNRNGTECVVSQNLITVIDKVPKFEQQKLINSTKKFQLKSVFIFLDIISKQKMAQYSENLKNSITNYSKIIKYLSVSILILALGFQLYYSLNLGFQILYPITHLTYVLKNIKFTSAQQDKKQDIQQKQSFEQTPNKISSQQNQKQYFMNENNSKKNSENEIQINLDINQDFEGVCFSKDTQELLHIFKNMFEFLSFINKTFFNQDESTKLLNLIRQVQHFEKIKNYRSLGVCYNNIAVIHYNNNRYLESIKNFQKAVIYANYELDVYSHQNAIYFNKNQHSALFFNQQNPSLSNSYFDYLNFNKEREESYNCSDILQLYQNLFNRKFNLLKVLIPFLRQQPGLWDIFQEFASELLYLCKQFLPQSNKREMLMYNAILMGFFNSNEFSSVSHILQMVSDLYLKKSDKIVNQRNKTQKSFNLKRQSSIKILQNHRSSFNFFQQMIKNNKYLTKDEIFQQNKQQVDDKILLEPTQKQKKQKIIKNPENNLQESKKFNNQQKNKENKQFNSEETFFANIDSIQMKPKTNSIFKREIDQVNCFSKIKNNQKSQESPNYEHLHQKQCLQLQNTNLFDINEKSNIQLSQSNQIEQEQASVQKLIQKSTFYEIRKTQNNNKTQEYEFNSDIYFQYYALSQSSYQIYLNNYYNAATVLTNCFEKCRYYLPHLKLQALNKLSSIFNINGSQQENLEVQKNSYEKSQLINYHIYVISSSSKKNNKKKVYQMCKDLLNCILHKEYDVFGLIKYSNQDLIFEQIIALASLKTLKSNTFIVDRILQFLYNPFHQRQQQKNDCSIEMNTFQQQLKQNKIIEKPLSCNQHSNYFSIKSINKKSSNKIQHFNEQNEKNQDHFLKRENYLENSKTIEDKSSEIFQKTANYSEDKSSEIFSKTPKDLNKNFYLQVLHANTSSCNFLKKDSSIDIKNEETLNVYYSTRQISKEQDSQQHKIINQNRNESRQNHIKQYLKQQLKNKNVLQFFDDDIKNQELKKKEQKLIFQAQESKCCLEEENRNIKENKQMQNQIQYGEALDHKNNYNSQQINSNASHAMKDIPDSILELKENIVKIQKAVEKKRNQNLKYSSEYIFHQGIQAVLKQFILNSNIKISCYLQMHKSMQKNKELKISKNNQKFIIYATDMELHFQNRKLLNDLSLFLFNFDIELLILLQNHSQQLDEYSEFQDILKIGKQVIMFFKDEQNLLLYIYNNREHVQNNFYPMMIEYF